MARYLMILAGILVSLLPARYRRWWPLETTGEFLASAVLSGVLQTMGCFFLLTGRFIDFFQGPSEIGTAVLNAPMEWVPINGVGILLLAEFLFDPLHIAMTYLTIEGAVRTFAAVGGEPLPTLPLALVAAMHAGVGTAWTKLKLGRRVVDRVVHAPGAEGHDLEVYSCRPKPDWDRWVSVEFDGAFYHLVRTGPAPAPRRFVFYLKKNPPGRLVVVVRHYDVSEGVERRQHAGRRSGSPGP